MWPVLAVMPLFGGEDPLAGGPWYHEDLTLAAARAAGWGPGAGAELAWHARMLDDYLYNPRHRLQPSRSRREALRAIRPQLESLHFDNLFSTAAVAQAWDRYTTGCVAAVRWSADRGDVAAARHAVGLTLHALQDFSSHSTWLDDPARRDRTWWDVPEAERAAMTVTTGSYGPPGPAGSHAHGGLVPSLSPRRPHPATVLGSRLLARLVTVAPSGINLDSRWLARVAVGVRALPDSPDANTLFDAALTLAGRTSLQWLTRLDDEFGGDPFWTRVRSGPPADLEAPFDDVARQSSRILAAGSSTG